MSNFEELDKLFVEAGTATKREELESLAARFKEELKKAPEDNLTAFYHKAADSVLSRFVKRGMEIGALDVAAGAMENMTATILDGPQNQLPLIQNMVFFHAISHIIIGAKAETPEEKEGFTRILKSWARLVDAAVDPMAMASYVNRLIKAANELTDIGQTMKKRFGNKAEEARADAEALKKEMSQKMSEAAQGETSIERAVVIDVDNTLIVKGELNTLITEHLITHFRENTIGIIIATGGDPETKREQLKALGFDTEEFGGVVSKNSLGNRMFAGAIDDSDVWAQGIKAGEHIIVNSDGSLRLDEYTTIEVGSEKKEIDPLLDPNNPMSSSGLSQIRMVNPAPRM